MSLYNQLCGVNPYAPALLGILVDLPEIPRFRDCFLAEEGHIVIFTRTGGGNRAHYETENAALRDVRGFLFDRDDSYDSTFAYFGYEPPAGFEDILAEIKEKQGTYLPMARFRQVLADLESGKETPETKRAKELGERIFGKIDKALKGDGPTIIEI